MGFLFDDILVSHDEAAAIPRNILATLLIKCLTLFNRLDNIRRRTLPLW